MKRRPAKLSPAAAAATTGYGPLLAELKERIRAAQVRAASSANRELIQLYWEVGWAITREQKSHGYGKGVVE